MDAGATFTCIPESIAEKLSLVISGEKVRASTAKGYEELNACFIEINDKRRVVPVLVSERIDRVLLGVIALEAMQLRINPVTGKLEEFTALLY